MTWQALSNFYFIMIMQKDLQDMLEMKKKLGPEHSLSGI